MTQFANFTDDHVPDPAPHQDRYRRLRKNQSGRVTIYENLPTEWIASTHTVPIEP